MWDSISMRKLIRFAILFSVGFIAISIVNFLLFIRPSKIAANLTPDQFNLPAEPVTLITDDGFKLSAWFIESPTQTTQKRALIFLHGYPAEKSDMLSIASSFYPDFSLFLLDLRYFGESEGYYTTLGIKEPRDVSLVLNFLEQKGYESIGIFGFSFGGAVGILTSARDSRVDAVSAYAAFADAKLLGYEVYRNLFFFKYPLVDLMTLWGRILFGEWIEEASPLVALRKLTIPVFLIHSKEDEQIAFTHAKLLGENFLGNSKAELYVLEKGFHGHLPFDFSQRVNAFFEEAL